MTGPFPARMALQRTSQRLRGLLRCTRAVSAIEFALIAPVFMAMMCMIYNLGQLLYGRSVLDGAVQVAARSSTLEGGNTSEADAKVRDMVRHVLPDANVTASRISYFDFNDIGRPETWDDVNDDGTCNDGEAYTDENRSGEWDADIGLTGNGGAGDVIIYEVSITYSPSFRLPFGTDGWNSATLEATTVKKNQPFAEQLEYGSEAGTCS